MFNTSNGTNNQNDSIVLSRQAVQRGLGQSLAFHTTRFDVHRPYRLFTTHPDIAGGLGVILPGTKVRVDTPMLAAIAVGDIPSSLSSVEPVVRYGKADDTGCVHRVVITTGLDGYVITSHGAYNLHTWSPVRMDQIRLTSTVTDSATAVPNEGGGGRMGTDAITVRITTVSLREPQVGNVGPRPTVFP